MNDGAAANPPTKTMAATPDAKSCFT